MGNDLNFVCPINKLGYGYTGFNFTKSLSANLSIALFPLGNVDFSLLETDDTSQIIKTSIENAKSYNKNAPCIRLWHQHDLSMFVGSNIHIGYPIFELDTFTSEEKHQLNSCDALFVCSEWAEKICRSNNITVPIHIVPLGVDRSIFIDTEIKDGPTTFFNCGKWEIRKGHDILIKAWNKVFSDSDNVMLYMCNSNPFLSAEQTDFWKNLYKKQNIRIVNRLPTSQDVATMMSMMDCGVFPSRAEGWNLEALEMLSSGKHLIITNYSAHTQFCNSKNSLLIDIDTIESANDGIWFNNQGNWASFGNKQIAQLADYMRYIHELKQKGKLARNVEGVNTANDFTWNNVSQILIGGLDVVSK